MTCTDCLVYCASDQAAGSLGFSLPWRLSQKRQCSGAHYDWQRRKGSSSGGGECAIKGGWEDLVSKGCEASGNAVDERHCGTDRKVTIPREGKRYVGLQGSSVDKLVSAHPFGCTTSLLAVLGALLHCLGHCLTGSSCAEQVCFQSGAAYHRVLV